MSKPDYSKLFSGMVDGLDIEAIFGALKPQVVACRACGQKNRLKTGREAPRCGKCGLPLVRS
jgi:hypothetical protein